MKSRKKRKEGVVKKQWKQDEGEEKRRRKKRRKVVGGRDWGEKRTMEMAKNEGEVTEEKEIKKEGAKKEVVGRGRRKEK